MLEQGFDLLVTTVVFESDISILEDSIVVDVCLPSVELT